MSSLTQLWMLPQPFIPGGMAAQLLLPSCYEPPCGARVRGWGEEGERGGRAGCLEDGKGGREVRGALCLTCMKQRQVWEPGRPGHCRPDPVTWKKERCLDCGRLWGKRGEKLDVDKGEMKVD